MIGYTPGTRVNDLVGALGIPGGHLGAQIDMLNGNPVGALRNLQDGYTEAAMGRGTNGFQRAAFGGMAPAGFIPSPVAVLPMMGPLCGAGYCGGYQGVDLANGASHNQFFGIYMDKNRQGAAKLERLLKTNPSARAAFENSVGGRITSFGKSDGVMTIQRFPPYAPVMGFGVSPLASQAGGIFGGYKSALLGAGLLGGGAGMLAGGLLGGMTGSGLWGGMVLGGLSGLGAGLGAGMLGAGGGMGGLPGLGHGAFGFGGLVSPMGGRGMGSWNPLAMPGRMQNTNPLYESAHQMQVAGVLNDPSLTVEDKVTLMLMLIMKKMDKDIERQAQYINSIQQQQSKRGKGQKGLGMLGTVAGGALGGPMGAKVGGGVGGKMGGGGNSPSIDVETMKLKRMIDKRGQMFDMLRQIIDKYNETAKGVIQSIGR